MSIYYGTQKVGSTGVNSFSAGSGDYVKKEDFESYKSEMSENLENMKTEINQTITTTVNNTVNNVLQEYTTMNTMSNPESLLTLDSSKYYNTRKLLENSDQLTATNEITLCEYVVKQYQVVRFGIEYDSIANDTTRQATIQIWVDNGQNDNLFDKIFTDTVANSHHTYQRWFQCTSGTKITVKATPKAVGTKINANLKVNQITVFQISDQQIYDWDSNEKGVKYKHIASEIFTYNGTNTAKMLVAGKSKFWSDKNSNGKYTRLFNSNQSGRLVKYVGEFNTSTNKKIKDIPLKIIPSIEYCISGKMDNTHDQFECWDPCSTSTWAQKLSSEFYYVFDDTLSVEISDINPIGATGVQYKITNKTFNSIFQQLSSTNVMKDDVLYNTSTINGKQNSYWFALIKLKSYKNGRYLFDVVQEMNQSANMQSFQFNEVDIDKGDMFCVLTNAWSCEKMVDQNWDFKICESMGS